MMYLKAYPRLSSGTHGVPSGLASKPFFLCHSVRREVLEGELRQIGIPQEFHARVH
jgi:hypothetical protein